MKCSDLLYSFQFFVQSDTICSRLGTFAKMAVKKAYLFAVLLLLNYQIQQSTCFIPIFVITIGALLGYVKLVSDAMSDRDGLGIQGLKLHEEVRLSFVIKRHTKAKHPASHS